MRNYNYIHNLCVIIVVVCLICVHKSSWAQSFQPCIVKEYNEELAKTPLGGVEVFANDAGHRVSDANGELTLRFLTKNVGDHVEGVEISKIGYELFNTDAIAQWNISGESKPFTIVMCKSERFKKIKDNYNRISSESYAKQKRKEEKLLEQERREGRLKEAEYKRKLQELQDEFDKQSLSVRPYIDHFSRIDLSEISDQERIIVKLVNSGRIDSAIMLYKQMNLEERFRDNRYSYSKLNDATKVLDEAMLFCNNQRDTILLQIWTKNDLLMMQGGKENIKLVEKSYKEIADQDTTYLYGLSAYAAFLYGQHRDRENIRYLRLIAKCGERECHHRLSSMYSSIANAYFNLGENDSVEVYLKRAKEANDKYNKKDSIEYIQNLYGYYNTMAQLYDRIGDYYNAEKASEKGLEYARRLYNIDKSKNTSFFKMALALAISFNHSKPISVIEDMNNMYSELPFSSDKDVNEDMEMSFGTINIISYLLNHGNSKLAKRHLKDVIGRIKPLYDKNEGKYRPILSSFYFLMGSLYYREQDFSNAQNYLERGNLLQKMVYDTNQNAQMIETIVIGLKMLGDIKSKYGYREIADSLYERALLGCESMPQADSLKTNYIKSIILNDKAMHFIRYEEIDSAMKALETKNRIDSIIKKSIPDSCSSPTDWDIRYELAKLYNKKGLFYEAKKVIRPCVDVIDDHTFDVNLLYVSLLINTKEYAKAIIAIESFDKLLIIWKKLSSTPNKYGAQDEDVPKYVNKEYDNEKRCIMQHYKAISYHALGKKKKARKIWYSIRNRLPEDIYMSSPLKRIFEHEI